MSKRHIICFVLALSLGAMLSPGSAGELVAPQLKAVFTFNFARFTHWPESVSTQDELGICYSEQASVASRLAAISERKIADKTLVPKQVRLPGNVSGCHVFFIHDSDPQRLQRHLGTLRELPILTIGDATNFAQNGGMIQLFEKNRKIRFRINLKAVRQGKLRLDSQLLGLAAEVIK